MSSQDLKVLSDSPRILGGQTQTKMVDTLGSRMAMRRPSTPDRHSPYPALALRPWPPSPYTESEQVSRWTDGQVTEDIVMRVRHLDAASAKQNLEEKEVQLERAATFLQEKHQELNNVEAALYRNAENLSLEEGSFHAEVTKVRGLYEQCKDELSVQAVTTRNRQELAEARIRQESDQISKYKAELLQESYRYSNEWRHAESCIEAARVEVQGRAAQLNQEVVGVHAEKRRMQQIVAEESSDIQREAAELNAEKRKLQMLHEMAVNQSSSSSAAEPLLRHELVEAHDRLRTFESQARSQDEHLAQLRAAHEVRAQENTNGLALLDEARSSNWQLRSELEATQARLHETQEAAAALRDAVRLSGGVPVDDDDDEEYDYDGNDDFGLTYSAPGMTSWQPPPATSATPTAKHIGARGSDAEQADRLTANASPGPSDANLHHLVSSLAESVAKLAETTAMNRLGSSDALERLADAASAQRQTLKPDKPKLTAASPAVLHAELKALRLFFNDARVHERSQWWSGARAIASGRAFTTLNSYIVQKFGSDDFFQEKLKDRSWPAWESHWKAFESLLKLATGLDDAGELSEAVTIYNGVSLKNKQSVDATDQFLTDYTAARTGMIEQGLIIAHDPKSQQREVEDLKKKLEGSDVLKYLMELPDFPQEVNDLDPAKAKGTILGRIRQWVRARRGPGLAGTTTAAKQNNDNNLFLKNQLRKVTNLLKGSKDTKDSQLLAEDGKRFRAARNPKGGKGDAKGKKVRGNVDCPRCHGHHPECKECPNSAAAAEEGFDVGAHSKTRLPCWYDYLKRGHPCGGFGHVSRHHEPVLKDESRKEIEAWKAARQKKPKGQKGGKGGGKKEGQEQGSAVGHERHSRRQPRSSAQIVGVIAGYEVW